MTAERDEVYGVGTQHGCWTVLEVLPFRDGQSWRRCRCRCGAVRSMIISACLQKEHKYCCQCRPLGLRWRVGVRFGDLTIARVHPGTTRERFAVVCSRGHKSKVSRRVLATGRCRKCDPRPQCKTRLRTGKSLQEWADIYGVTRQAISRRMKKYGSPHLPGRCIVKKLKAKTVRSRYADLRMKEHLAHERIAPELAEIEAKKAALRARCPHKWRQWASDLFSCDLCGAESNNGGSA